MMAQTRTQLQDFIFQINVSSTKVKKKKDTSLLRLDNTAWVVGNEGIKAKKVYKIITKISIFSIKYTGQKLIVQGLDNWE